MKPTGTRHLHVRVEPGERVLWTGSPDAPLVRRSDVPALASLGVAAASSAPLVATFTTAARWRLLVPLVGVVVGGVAVVRALRQTAKKKREQRYVLTDRRAVVVHEDDVRDVEIAEEPELDFADRKGRVTATFRPAEGAPVTFDSVGDVDRLVSALDQREN